MSVLALVSGLMASCKDEDSVTVGEKVGSDIVTFANEENKSLALTDSQFTITFQRADGKGELTVPVEIVQSADVFENVPQSVTFADGETTKDVTIDVTEDAKPFVYYPLVLTIPAKYAGNTYLDAQTSFPRLEITVHKEDFKPYGQLMYQCWFFEDQWEETLYYSEYLDIYRCEIYTPDYPIYFKEDTENNTISFVDVNGVEQQDMATGFEYGDYGPVTMHWDNETDIEYKDGVYYFYAEFKVAAGSFGSNYNALMIVPDGEE